MSAESPGSRIKAVATAAGEDFGQMLDRKIHLLLFVTTCGNRRDDPERCRAWRLDEAWGAG